MNEAKYVALLKSYTSNGYEVVLIRTLAERASFLEEQLGL
jgi:hypothetical protein